MSELDGAIAIAAEHVDAMRPLNGRGRDPTYVELAAAVGRRMTRRTRDGRAKCIAILAAEWMMLERRQP